MLLGAASVASELGSISPGTVSTRVARRSLPAAPVAATEKILSLTWRSPPNGTAGNIVLSKNGGPLGGGRRILVRAVKDDVKAIVPSGGSLGEAVSESKKVRVASEGANGGMPTRTLTLAATGCSRAASLTVMHSSTKWWRPAARTVVQGAAWRTAHGRRRPCRSRFWGSVPATLPLSHHTPSAPGR